jgi:hypothetical protein
MVVADDGGIEIAVGVYLGRPQDPDHFGAGETVLHGGK